ncbi:MAG: hypothetical protein KJ893_04895 [Candidatus Omnitrophica bacterium]|nr:hypothetical protein [Candidatus Omnitrophota bacterium]
MGYAYFPKRQGLYDPRFEKDSCGVGFVCNVKGTKTNAIIKYHACLMEPWDGPAAIAFTDGTRIGAVLDRNGLRPARYILTKDDFVVMSSEVGVLDIPPEAITASGRLEPGKMFFIDTEEGRIIDDREIKEKISRSKPYRKWLKEQMVDLSDLAAASTTQNKIDDLLFLLKAFGYTREDLKFLIKPMAETAY